MKYKLCFQLVLTLLLSVSIASAQLQKISGGRYTTGINRIESDLAPGEKVAIMSVTSLSGKLYIHAGEGEEVVFEYKRLIKCGEESLAREYDELTEVEIQKTPAALKLFLRAPNPAPWSGTNNSVVIEGDLTLPPDCQLEIDAEYYDLIVEGPFTSLENQASLGKMDISNISRSLIVSADARDMTLENISGDISVTISNADVTAQNLVTKDETARIKNENGNVFIEDIDGNFVIRNSYGKIRVSGVVLAGDNSRIIGTHCPIKVEVVESVDAGLSISDDYEDVTLEIADHIPARFTLDVEGDGEIHIVDIPVKPLIVRSDRMECMAGDGRVPINIDLEESGNIFIEGIQVDK